MTLTIDREALLARFLRYVQVDTTADDSSTTTPSSACQWTLAKLLAEELTALGVSEVRVSDRGYVYGKLPENLPASHPRAGKVPAVGFISHLDTSPALTGKDVKPIVHRGYNGGPIVLPGAPDVVLTPETDRPLGECVGLTVITSDGTTLLGADDKAGIAIIMTAIEALQAHPEVLHGPLCVGFTPDEEIGRGADHFDVAGFGAKVAYTVDGESLGEFEDETFCADGCLIRFTGVSVHPGYAKGKLVNAAKLACELVARLPKDGLSPETTSGREGFVHPHSVTGTEESATVKFIVRDFTEAGLKEKEAFLKGLAEEVAATAPKCRVEVEVTQQYRNMKAVLDQHPQVAAFAEAAIAAAGLTPKHHAIRGGTDGSRLSYMGLPTPNLFTGGHNYHGRREWVALEHMEKSAEVCLHLIALWAERG